eukprot:6213075-Pleurochrysis_carterae.AAC.1
MAVTYSSYCMRSSRLAAELDAIYLRYLLVACKVATCLLQYLGNRMSLPIVASNGPCPPSVSGTCLHANLDPSAAVSSSSLTLKESTQPESAEASAPEAAPANSFQGKAVILRDPRDPDAGFNMKFRVAHACTGLISAASRLNP